MDKAGACAWYAADAANAANGTDADSDADPLPHHLS
jgi:hypothetical protein